MAETYKEHLYALIVCGGAGTRLWPRSRKATPKQFLEKFYGEKTLFKQTFDRVKLLTDSNKIFVITLSDYADEILQQAQDILPRNIICEPFGKNTAMAIGAGAAYIKKIDPKAIIMNFWSDAIIKEDDLFSERLTLAVEAASSGDYLVIVGLKPTFPHTGLGYIEAGAKFPKVAKDVFLVNSFKEKPNLEIAKNFLTKGNFYWNTGIFVWSAESIFKAFSKASPEIFSLLEELFDAIGTSREKEVLLNAYEKVENQSIDLAVSEKADNMLLVPANFTWSDIGDWKATYDMHEKDENGNVIENFGEGGAHLGFETKNCLVEAQSRLIATVGVSDLVIVEMDDVVLVCSRERAQDVKNIVNALKEQKKDQYL